MAASARCAGFGGHPQGTSQRDTIAKTPGGLRHVGSTCLANANRRRELKTKTDNESRIFPLQMLRPVSQMAATRKEPIGMLWMLLNSCHFSAKNVNKK